MTDFSQSGEQELILEWAEGRGDGRFLDIGAADGEAASNSRALALAGWRGVCVEPAALMFDRLATLYAERADVICVQAALVPDVEHRLIPFHMAHDLVSTTVDRYADTWAELVEFVPCYVAALSVDELLAATPGPYDFCTIDTEGTTLALWDRIRKTDGVFVPGSLVCIEAENGGERWEIQQACLDGWARVATTPNNVLLEAL